MGPCITPPPPLSVSSPKRSLENPQYRGSPFKTLRSPLGSPVVASPSLSSTRRIQYLATASLTKQEPPPEEQGPKVFRGSRSNPSDSSQKTVSMILLLASSKHDLLHEIEPIGKLVSFLFDENGKIHPQANQRELFEASGYFLSSLQRFPLTESEQLRNYLFNGPGSLHAFLLRKNRKLPDKFVDPLITIMEDPKKIPILARVLLHYINGAYPEFAKQKLGGNALSYFVLDQNVPFSWICQSNFDTALFSWLGSPKLPNYVESVLPEALKRGLVSAKALLEFFPKVFEKSVYRYQKPIGSSSFAMHICLVGSPEEAVLRASLKSLRKMIAMCDQKQRPLQLDLEEFLEDFDAVCLFSPEHLYVPHYQRGHMTGYHIPPSQKETTHVYEDEKGINTVTFRYPQIVDRKTKVALAPFVSQFKHHYGEKISTFGQFLTQDQLIFEINATLADPINDPSDSDGFYLRVDRTHPNAPIARTVYVHQKPDGIPTVATSYLELFVNLENEDPAMAQKATRHMQVFNYKGAAPVKPTPISPQKMMKRFLGKTLPETLLKDDSVGHRELRKAIQEALQNSSSPYRWIPTRDHSVLIEMDFEQCGMSLKEFLFSAYRVSNLPTSSSHELPQHSIEHLFEERGKSLKIFLLYPNMHHLINLITT